MPIKAIIIIGWRSDAGAYQVDAFPPETDIHPQDLMNLFSLHRMGANNDLSKAIANFNFLKAEEGLLISWYSGFQSTRYIAKPNFCVTLLADHNENANKWEMPLEIITYNLLSKLTHDNFHAILEQYLKAIKDGYQIDPLPGFISQYDESVVEPPLAPPSNAEKPVITSSETKDDYNDLLSLVEPSESDSGNTQNFGSSFDDPFSMGDSSKDPFSSLDPFASNTSPNQASGASVSNMARSGAPAPIDQNILSKSVITELEKIDRTIPQRPSTDNPDQLIKFLEKKVTFLESKISILSKLVQGLQSKENELSEKNDLIGKLLLLLS